MLEGYQIYGVVPAAPSVNDYGRDSRWYRPMDRMHVREHRSDEVRRLVRKAVRYSFGHSCIEQLLEEHGFLASQQDPADVRIHGQDVDADLIEAGRWHGRDDTPRAVKAPVSGCIVVIESGYVLSPVSSKNIGGYGLPGGKAKRGETPRACAIRECREETGILAVKTTLLYRAHCEGFDCWTFFAEEWQGYLQSSVEGAPRWVEPQMLLVGRYREYNQGVLYQLARWQSAPIVASKPVRPHRRHQRLNGS